MASPLTSPVPPLHYQFALIPFEDITVAHALVQKQNWGRAFKLSALAAHLQDMADHVIIDPHDYSLPGHTNEAAERIRAEFRKYRYDNFDYIKDLYQEGQI